MTSLRQFGQLFRFRKNPRQLGLLMTGMSLDDLDVNTIDDNGAGTVTIEDPRLNSTIGGTTKGVANGFAELDGTGKVPLAQLPPLSGSGYVKLSARAKTITALAAYTQVGVGPGATLTANANGVLPAIDGVVLAAGERVLVDDDGTAVGADRGIYVVSDVGSGGTPWVLTRWSAYDEDSEVMTGDSIYIESGGSSGGGSYVLVTGGTIVVDVTALSYARSGSTSGVIVSSSVMSSSTSSSYSKMAVYTHGGVYVDSVVVVTSMDVGVTSYDVRLYDVTGAAVVQESLGNVNTLDASVTLVVGAHYGSATIFEIQIRKNGGGVSDEVYLRYYAVQ